MVDSARSFLSTLPIALLLAAGIAVWVGLLRQLRRGRPLLVAEPRRPVPWTAIEVLLAFAMYPVFGQVVFACANDDLQRAMAELGGATPLDDQQGKFLLVADSLAKLATAVFAVWLVRWRCGATWRDLGLATGNLARQATIGLTAFFAVAVPIYWLQRLLVTWLQDYLRGEHPILECLEAHREIGLWAMASVAVVIVTPLVEELLFRVLLQGWFERLAASTSLLSRVEPAAAEEPAASSVPVEEQPWPAVEEPTLPPAGWHTLWPILASSSLFALVHIAHGPAPIPLFFLALVLGYLYRQTHRIWPCVALHASLNACSLLILWWSPIPTPEPESAVAHP